MQAVLDGYRSFDPMLSFEHVGGENIDLYAEQLAGLLPSGGRVEVTW